MTYLIIILRCDNDDGFIFASIKTWIPTVPCTVYIYGGTKNYGFEYAMRERASNISFVNSIEHNNEDYLIILKPNQYLKYDYLTNEYLISKEDYLTNGIQYYLNNDTRFYKHSSAILDLDTDIAMLNYHKYKDAYTFYSKIHSSTIPSFPAFARSIHVADSRLIASLVATLLKEAPLERTLYLSNGVVGLEGLTSIGYTISYECTYIDVIVSNEVPKNWELYAKALYVPGRHEGTYTCGWTISCRENFRQRRVDIAGYFNEVDMLKMRIKELYDTVDLFLIGQMDTPYSSNERIVQGFPSIEDPENKVRLITLSYPEEIKQLDNSVWVKDKYYRQYSIYFKEITDFDLLFILDLDEIPDVNTINKECNHYINTVCRLEMKLYYYNFNWAKRYNWYHGYIGHVKEIRKYGSDKIRINSPIRYGVIQNGGWHISYFLTPEMIKKKIESFAHQEFNRLPFTDINHINNAIKLGLDLYNRGNENMIQADYSYRPKYYNLISFNQN